MKTGPKHGVVTLAISALQTGEQMLLPFTQQLVSNAHTKASRLGIKIVTRKLMKHGTEWLQLTRVA
jgi:hypothetical protein